MVMTTTTTTTVMMMMTMMMMMMMMMMMRMRMTVWCGAHSELLVLDDLDAVKQLMEAVEQVVFANVASAFLLAKVSASQ
jgi:hypothetical protein